MNGVHDLGGLHGFGPVRPEADEPLFHAPWEARALALTLAMAGWRKWNIDASRHARERIPPADYLRDSYYERWMDGLCRLMLEQGLVTAEELASGRPAAGSPRATPPITPDKVLGILNSGGPTERPLNREPLFAVGQRVRARNLNPEGHTRLPRYVRGKLGTIERLHGAHVYPDTNARFRGENPEPLYNVRFEAAELWGPDARFRGGVLLDLWEPYLEAV